MRLRNQPEARFNVAAWPVWRDTPDPQKAEREKKRRQRARQRTNKPATAGTPHQEHADGHGQGEQ